MRVRYRITLGVALLTTGLFLRATAQSVRGRVFQSALDRPLAGALVQIQDTQGRNIATGMTNANGVFWLQVQQPGRYRWRVAAIGFAPRRLDSVTVTAAGVVLPDVVLRPLAMQLADITAHGQRICGLRAGDAPLFDGVLEAAEIALDVMQLTIASGSYRFEVKDTVILTGRATAPITSTGLQSLAMWPVLAIDPEKLHNIGFSEIDSSTVPALRSYYGPDPQVLFAPWFLAEHCYSFPKNARATDSTITLRFEPVSNVKADIAGEMLFDRATMSLRRLTWEHINLPTWIRKEDTGGYLEFASLGGELWYPSKWSMKGPVETSRITGRQMPGGPVVGTVAHVFRVLRVIKN